MNNPNNKLLPFKEEEYKFDCDEFYVMIDVFMERYKMSFEEVMQMPIPVFQSLQKAIEDRSKIEEKEYNKRKNKK